MSKGRIAHLSRQIYDNRMRQLGKSLQVIGLIVLPLAIYFELSGGMGRSGVGESFSLANMLKMSLFGVTCFVLGYMVEGYARK